MPTPVGHSLSGVCFYLLFNKIKIADIIRSWKNFLLYVIIACLPDIDFIRVGAFYISIDKINHQKYTHSIGFGMLVCVLTFLIIWFRKRKFEFKRPLIFGILMVVHGFMDTFGYGLNPVVDTGVRLLWPFSSAGFVSPYRVFRIVNVYCLLSMDTIIGLFSELVVLVPIMILIVAVKFILGEKVWKRKQNLENNYQRS